MAQRSSPRGIGSVDGVVTPELAQRARMEAKVHSHTEHAMVSLSMEDHLQRAESYHSTHKKQFAALNLEFHQLAEVCRRLDATVAAIEDQRRVAQKHMAALPPYDASSRQAMEKEVVELENGIAALEAQRRDVQECMSELQQCKVMIAEEMSFLQVIVTRDKFITATDTAPRRDDPRLTFNKTALSAASSSGHNNKPAEGTLPDINDRAVSVSGSRSPRMVNGSSKPATPAARNGRTSTQPNGRVNGVNWPSVIAQSHVLSCQLIRTASQLAVASDTLSHQVTSRSQAQRSQVVKDQTHAIDVKMMQRQRLLMELDAIDAKVFETKKLWRSTSEQVKQMKEPLQASAARHEIRETVEDQVGHALLKEQSTLAKTRHELKKVCRSLAEQVDSLEQLRKTKTLELESLDAQLKTDREHCSVENPAGIFSRAHPIRVTAIRTFPHLLATREIFGTTNANSSPRSGRSESPRTPLTSSRPVHTPLFVAPFAGATSSRIPAPPITAKV